MSRRAHIEEGEISATSYQGQTLPLDLYRQVFRHSREAIAIVTPEGSYIEQNAAHQKLLGYSDEELEGNSPWLQMGPGACARVLSDLAGKGEFQDEMICKTKSGELLQLELSAFAMLGKDRRPVCYVEMIRDITNRKRGEQRAAVQHEVTRILSHPTDFLSICENILRAICKSFSWDSGAIWKVDGANGRLRRIYQWPSEKTETAIPQSYNTEREIEMGVGLPGRVWARAAPIWVPDLREDESRERGIIAVRRSGFGFPVCHGREVLGAMEFYSRETRQPDGGLMDLMASIGHQIGEFSTRRRAEEERVELLESERSARADAEQANRLKDEFLATLSHELRTPLNAVIGWARMLKSGRLDQESAEHALQVIERNAWAQKQIIEDILDVSRVVTGKLQLKVAPLDLVTVVEGALDAVRPAIEAKEIRVETIIDAGLKMISGDADRLQQVVWNLLSNAVKFSPPGGKVEISVSQTGGHMQIRVSDTGPGIDPAFLPHVFERFRQADGSTTRTHGGLGLGLAIVRHLVELHGGVITAENAANGGAVFTVRLPLPSGELRPETLTNAASVFKELYAEPVNLKGLRILVIDDESDALDLIAMELTQHGAMVKGVTSSQEALTLFEQEQFDLVIGDIGMPGIDGYELIKRIRQLEKGQQRRVPAVALTAYARVQDRMRAILAGFNTHVPKPVEANELITIVGSLTGRLGPGLSA